MDKNVKTNGSYAWQSILKARSVISLGSTWRIGNRKKVLIRGDNWLPDLHSGSVISPLKNFPSNTLVYALIDEKEPCWIEDHLTNEFLPHEVRSMLSIPLSNHRSEDTLIWKGTKNENYSTKSGYWFLS